MAQKTRRSAMPYLGAFLLGALAIVAWLWSETRGPAAPSTSPRATSSRSSDDDQPSQSRGTLADATTIQAVREPGRPRIAFEVQDMAGRVISGAQARLSGEAEVLAASDAAGKLTLDLPATAAGELEVIAEGFVPTLVAMARLVDGGVVRLRAMPGIRAAIRVVDVSAHGISGVTVGLTSSDEKAKRPTRSASTDEEGLAVVSGLEAGGYEVSLQLGPFDVSGFVQPQDARISVPGPETTVVLALPNVAWAKPSTGRIVVGYFRVPVGASDFGRAHSFLRRIEEHCQRSEEGALARAFMGDVGEVDLVALVDPGGWTTARIPVVGMAAEMTPTRLPNPDMDPVSFGNLTVRARSVSGEPIQDAPFALSMASATAHGSITFPIEFGVSQRLPAGSYTFVALQAGASSLFRGPKHAVDIEEDGNASVILQATRPLRRVAVAVEQWTRNGVQPDELGIVRVSDGMGFSTELRPSAESHAWLPTGQTLTARTRIRVGLRYVDLDGDFFVSDTGNDPTIIRLQERP